MKLLLDEMWSPAIAAALRERGHDVVAVAERSDLRGKPDDVIFSEAQVDGRAIVTENVVDYRPLASEALRAGRTAPTLILTSNRAYPRASRRTVGRLVLALDSLLSAGHTPEMEHWLD